MGQINLLKTDTPQTPATGKVGIFIDTTGQPKAVDDTGAETLLAGIADAPSDGEQYARQDGAWEIVNSPYPEATNRQNNTVLFDQDYIHDPSVAAQTGDILFSFTDAKLGAVTFMKHDNDGAYTFPADGEIRDFEVAKLALVTGDVWFSFTLVKKTASSEVVWIQLSLTAAQVAEYNA